MAAIDDTTGVVLAAHFRAQEDAQGYRQVLRGVINDHGIPVAIYYDRHGIAQLNTPETISQATGQFVVSRVLNATPGC